MLFLMGNSESRVLNICLRYHVMVQFFAAA